MSITINILYTGQNGSARKFAEEMVASGVVEAVRAEAGNERYEYYRWQNQQALDIHHKSDMMKKIAELRQKYNLKMKVERYTEL